MKEDFIPKGSANSAAAANLMEGDFTPRKLADSCLPFIVRPAGDAKFTVFSSAHDGFEAFVLLNVLKLISKAMAEAKPNETIGLLAGRVFRDAKGPYTLVLAAEGARKHEIEATPSHVRVSAGGHAQVRNRLEATAYGYDIVGWYHSHPRYPARFSPVDVTEQSTFRDKNHVGIVVSGNDEREPFGVYRGPKSSLLVAPERVPVPRLLAQTVERCADEAPADAHAAAEVPRSADAPTHAAAQVYAAPPLAGRGERLNRALPWLLTIALLGIIVCLLVLDARVKVVERLLKQTKVAGQFDAPGAGAPQAAAPPAQGEAGREIVSGGVGADPAASSPPAGQEPPRVEGSAMRANPLLPSKAALRGQGEQAKPGARARQGRDPKRKPRAARRDSR